MTPRQLFAQALAAKAASPILRAPAWEISKARSAPTNVTAWLEKSAIASAVSGTGYGDAATAAPDLAKQWFLTLRSQSVFARILDQGGIRVPLNRAFGVGTAPSTAYIVGEGKPAPLSLFGASRDALSAKKAVALMAISTEVASGSDEGSAAAIETEMAAAVSDAIDGAFWAAMGAGASGFSLGSSSGSFKSDAVALLDAVNTKGSGSLIWAMSPTVANRASLFDEYMSPTGGEILGLPAIVSAVVPSGTLRLVDASGVAGDLAQIEVDASQNATLEMKDASLSQDAATGAGAAQVSAFQTGVVALRAVGVFASSKVRANTAHEITGITSWTA